MKKLKSHKGETLIEVLVALLIVTLCISFLCTSMATAAKTNKAVREQNILPAVVYDENVSAVS